MKKICPVLFLIVLKLSYAVDLISNQLKVNGHLLHYYQTDNSGQPIILLTGYATTSNFWNKQFIECLAQNYQVFLFDYQGINTGEKLNVQKLSISSMAKDVNALVNQLKIKQPLLLGWSMGGAIALEATFLKPALYKQLYLLSPVVPLGNTTKLTFSMPEHQPFTSENDVINYVFNNNLYSYNYSQISDLKDNFIKSQVAQLFPDRQIYEAQDKAIAAWVSNQKIKSEFVNARTPAVFYIPDHDHIINQNIALPVIRQYPEATIIQVRNSGHAIAWQVPEAICKNLRLEQD